jgi:hypothetical protein
MTLFNGLLCAAGDDDGCVGTRNALDEAGQWHRSPRLARYPEVRPANAFSGDMALGAQLYLVKSKDKSAAEAWFRWLDEATTKVAIDKCPDLMQKLQEQASEPVEAAILMMLIAELGNVDWPTFCPVQPGCGCFLKFGDLAMLAETQRELGIAVLPAASRLRELIGTFGGRIDEIIAADAEDNHPGYSLHLVGVGIFLLREMKASGPAHDPSMTQGLDEAARTLAARSPTNPFFQYLAEGATEHVARLVLDACPEPGGPVPG